MVKPLVIVIVGPTASGKTSASIELAQKINGEIISADSMQIYKEMDIGTAKATADERNKISHHLIDIVSPDEKFNVTKYKVLAEKAIDEILEKGKIPIIVGGTGLYINTLVDGIEFTEISEDVEFRNKMQNLASENGNEYLHKMLEKVDPKSAQIIDANNVRRVIRALEIYHLTGKTKSKLDEESKKEVKYNYMMYGIETPRDILYERINKRVDLMLEQGLLEEVKTLIQKYDISNTAVQGLGYKEVIEFLNGQISYDDMVEKLKQETRKYAKRQLTWFRRDERIKLFGLNDIVFNILNDIK